MKKYFLLSLSVNKQALTFLDILVKYFISQLLFCFFNMQHHANIKQERFGQFLKTWTRQGNSQYQEVSFINYRT